jgi:2-haloacid dehalogenase
VADIKALAFDVFGTVVDWRGSIIAEGERWGAEKGLQVDWALFADRWREGYRPAMDKVRQGSLPWMNLDRLHRMILDDLLVEFRIDPLTEEEKRDWNTVWHRLKPWPDAVKGIQRLKEKFVTVTLSNGNMSLLVEMAKRAGLPWDAVLSAELFRCYKPDHEVYRGAVELLGCEPGEVLMVAAHPQDLLAAEECGLRTAFVHRAGEIRSPEEFAPGQSFDFIAEDFLDLAAKLP